MGARITILRLLAQTSPRPGKLLEDSGGVVGLSPLYAHLERLEADGLLGSWPVEHPSIHDDPHQRRYWITENGRRELARLDAELPSSWALLLAWTSG